VSGVTLAGTPPGVPAKSANAPDLFKPHVTGTAVSYASTAANVRFGQWTVDLRMHDRLTPVSGPYHAAWLASLRT